MNNNSSFLFSEQGIARWFLCMSENVSVCYIFTELHTSSFSIGEREIDRMVLFAGELGSALWAGVGLLKGLA